MAYTYRIRICRHHSKWRYSQAPDRALGTSVSGIPVISGLFQVARASPHNVYLSRGCVWVGIRRGRGVSRGGALQVTLLLYSICLSLTFINKVYQVIFKHLTEFILTTSYQPYHKSILSLIINQSQSKFNSKLQICY